MPELIILPIYNYPGQYLLCVSLIMPGNKKVVLP